MSAQGLLDVFKSLSVLDLPIGVYAVDNDAQIVACNLQVRQILAISTEEPLPLPIKKFYPDPSFRDQLLARFNELAERGEFLEKFILPLRTSRGDIYVLDYSRELRDINGERIGLLCAMVDVTNEERQRRVWDTLPVGFYRNDRDDRVVDCNEQFARLFGYSREEMLGRLAREFYSGEIAQEYKAQDHRLELLRKDGETFFASISSSALWEYGSYVGREGALIDVTEEEKYRRIIEEMPLGLFEVRCQPDGTEVIEHCNDQFAKMLDFSSPAEARGKKVVDYHPSEEKYRNLLRDIEQREQSGSILVGRTVELKTARGRTMIGEVSTRFRRRRGLVIGRVGALQDITEQEHTREQLQELAHDVGAVLHTYTATLALLAQSVEPVIDHLAPDPFSPGRLEVKPSLPLFLPARKRLEESLGRLFEITGAEPQRLAALPGHLWSRLRDLQSVIGQPISQNLEESGHAILRDTASEILRVVRQIVPGFLSRELVRSAEQAAQDLVRLGCLITLRLARNAAIEMDYVVRGLRESLSLERRMQEPRSRVRLLDLLRAALLQHVEYARSRGVEMRNHARVDAWVIVSERDAVRAIANLLHNAIKYSWVRRHGEVWSSVRTQLDPTGDFILLEVASWGVPIPPDEQELVFEASYRGRLSGDRQRAGTGIGLADARRVARRLGGEVWLTSHPASSEQGSGDLSRPFVNTACLKLPVAEKDT